MLRLPGPQRRRCGRVPSVPPSSHLQRARAHPHLDSLITPASAVAAHTRDSWGAVALSAAPKGPASTTALSEKRRGTPSTLRPAPRLSPAAPNRARGALGASPALGPARSSPLSPSSRRCSAPAPSSAGSQRDRRYLGVEAAACPGHAGLRPSRRLSGAISAQQPAAAAAAARFSGSGSDVTAGAERGRGAGGTAACLRLRPDPRCPFRLCAPTPSLPGPEPPGAPDPRLPLYVAECSENLGPGGAAGAQREEIRSPRERGQGSLGEGSGAEVRIRD